MTNVAGIRGRPPKPLKLQQSIARGDGLTPGKRRVPMTTALDRSTVNDIAIKVPPVPDHLQEKGREMWQQLWSDGALWLEPDSGDLHIMTMICENYDRVWVIDDIIERTSDDMLVKGYLDKGVAAHPLLMERRAARNEIVSWLAQQGFTVAARTKLALNIQQLQTNASNLADLQRKTAAGELPKRTRKPRATKPKPEPKPDIVDAEVVPDSGDMKW